MPERCGPGLVEYDPAYIRELLEDVRGVDVWKLLGYLPLSTIENICGYEPMVLAREVTAHRPEIKSLLLADGQSCPIGSGALFIYDSVRLHRFLVRPENSEILIGAGWPTNARLFALSVASTTAEDGPLYDLIAAAFGDKRPEYRAAAGTLE